MRQFIDDWWPLFLFAVLMLMVLGVMALFKPSRGTDSFDNPSRFRIESGGTGIGVALVTDRETGVQYLVNTRTGTCTVLLDKDGNPYIANGWRDYAG